jgi:hypothetical protein
MKLVIALILLLILIFLIRRNLLRVDMSFPLFAAIIVLGFASNNDDFVDTLAVSLGIIYAPLAIILLAIFIILALVTTLMIVVSQIRHNQIALVRRIAEIDLDQQEIIRMTRISEKQTQSTLSDHPGRG